MRTDDEMVAYALETTPSLLPYMPELLADLQELGADAELIVEALNKLALPRSARVIDLGCGKGAVSVKIADRLRLQVLGIDLFKPFIENCIKLSENAGVADLCEFHHGDILKLAGQVEPADVVVIASLGDVLGRLDETIRVIREFAEPGGVIIVNDDYVRDGCSNSFPGFESYVSYGETIERLTACGDIVQDEVLAPQDDSDKEYSEVILIRQRGIELARKHPELEADLMSFVQGQQSEIEFIQKNLQAAVWVLRRI